MNECMLSLVLGQVTLLKHVGEEYGKHEKHPTDGGG